MIRFIYIYIYTYIHAYRDLVGPATKLDIDLARTARGAVAAVLVHGVPFPDLLKVPKALLTTALPWLVRFGCFFSCEKKVTPSKKKPKNVTSA